MKHLNKIGILLVLVIAVAIVFFVIKCSDSDSNIKDEVLPQLTVAKIQITEFDSKTANLKLDLSIDNPLPVGVTIDSMHYKVFVEDYEVVKDHYTKPIKLEGNDTSGFTVPVILYYSKLIKQLKEWERKGVDSIMYKVDAIAYTSITGKKEISLSAKRYLPLIKIPEISIIDVDIEDVKISGAMMNFTAIVRNKNVFKIAVKKITYNVLIEDQQAMKDTLPGVYKFPAEDSVMIIIPIKIDHSELNKSLVDLLLKGGRLKYDITATMILISDLTFLQDSKLTLSANGQLKEITQAIKEARRNRKKKAKNK